MTRELDPHTRQVVLDAVSEQVNRALLHRVDDTATLERDLGYDALDMVELVLALEERVRVGISDETMESWSTVGDVLDTVARQGGEAQ